ncbi:MAG: hypothetical protein IJU23_09790 [Proteobacteria bacterium]|nr:hypothetical protein [Pseudomonadota bacterium]
MKKSNLNLFASVVLPASILLVSCGEGELIVSDVDGKEMTCHEAAKPYDNCTCKGLEWICESVPEQKKCPDDCTGTCVDGVCTPKEDEHQGEEVDVCPKTCPDNCIDGVCNGEPNACPESCPDDCTDGKCNSDVTVTCPDACPDNCTDGVCPEPQKKCPESCPDACDENGICESTCPDECPTTCLDDGSCPTTCPASCKTSCDDHGVCQCPETCTTNCDDTGSCLCAPSCKTSCDGNGVCQCSSTCKTSCDANGVCQCPSTCKTSCDDNGVCQCPSSCKTSCDANGVCQCPSTCATTCDANGVCPAMCGSEVIKSFKFGATELDILDPSFSGRTSSYSTLFIKTEKNSYDLSNAPCKDKIKLKASNTNVIKVSKNVGCKFDSVGVGEATCTATLDGTNLSASVKVRVLNPNHFKDNLAEKKDGKYTHIYSGLLTLNTPTRVSQGFDFYSSDFMYFSQLKYNQKLTNGTTLKKNGAIIFQNKPQDNNSKPMTLVASGHAQNLSIERTDGKDYVWVGNYGTLISGSEDEGYKHSQTVCRIEYQPGKVFTPDQVADQYAISDSSSYYYNFEPALDQKNNKFGVKSIYKGDGLVHIKLYNLAKVKALTPKKVQLKKPIITVEKSGDDYKLTGEKKYSITAKDLSTLEPTNEFSIKSADFPLQGWEIENGIIYTVNGMPEDKVSGNYLYQSKIILKLFTYNGKLLATYYLRTSSANNNYLVNKDLDGALAQTIDGVNYFNVGYFEPEGIRVSDGKAYISVTTHLGTKENGKVVDTPRRQMIFVYDLMQK